MRINKIEISNYRGIKYANFNPEDITCIIGENNAGKSSILLALSLFFSGSSISKSEYYNEDEEIRINCSFSDIDENEYNRLAPEHKERIKDLCVDEELLLSRIYDIDGKSKLYYQTIGPKDPRLKRSVIDSVLKGKKGKEITTALSELIPEEKSQFVGLATQKAGKEKIQEIIDLLTPEEKELQPEILPTGIDSSIKNLLPEPIYIAAVKDLKDDIKTSESTTFGRLLGILMRFLEQSVDFQNIRDSFDELDRLLNTGEDGSIDNRIDKIVSIEKSIETYLQENFPNTSVEIQVPKPEMKQIFSNSKIFIDDGVKDTIHTKGDGIKRSLTFSLLRTYVDHLKEHNRNKFKETQGLSEVDIPLQPYIFLFEEPELYLHPNAQKILFNALENISNEDNQVFVTTHSPLFFSPDSTGAFIKVKKIFPETEKPYGDLLKVAINSDISYKDAFQLICYENNTPAFFANKVLLVEGDSDYIYLKEIAKCLNDEWNFEAQNIPIIRISGKSNVKRFKNFYKQFDVEVFILVDQDTFIDGFDKFELEQEILEKRDQVLQIIDQKIGDKGYEADLPKRKIKELVRRYTWKERYDKLKEIAIKVKSGASIEDDELIIIDYLFSEENNNLRRRILEEERIDEVEEFISELYLKNIFILSKGAIESYYPDEVSGDDKPTKALNAIKKIKADKSTINGLPKIKISGEDKCELSSIFSKIFENEH